MSAQTSSLGRLAGATVAALGFALLVGSPSACSLDNQEGPLVTCEDLQCGRVNACQDGIIAQCADGRNVRYHVCGTEDVCSETWQLPGQYRCEVEITDCEGCRPERSGCDDIPQGGGGAGGSGATTATTTTTTTTSTGTGGSGGN